jgi:hypothetical protein
MCCYFKPLDRICADNYKASNEDILNLRTTTVSISETIIIEDERPIHVFDVSGLDYHRKQWVPYLWLHCRLMTK